MNDASVPGFLALHRPGDPLLMPNAWDVGTARIFETEGFSAIATTSGGHAGTLGLPDGSVGRDEALAHAADLVAAVGIPVSADFEDGFATDPEGVADTVRAAREVGLAGCSIEDSTRGSAQRHEPIHPFELSVERVAAAAEAAHAGSSTFVLTARAENFLHGRDDLDDTIARLLAYEAAGADVLYAPRLVRSTDIARVVEAVSRPVNVLLVAGGPTVAELAELGAARISVGGSFHLVAMGAVAEAARDLRAGGPHAFWPLVATGRAARDASFRS